MTHTPTHMNNPKITRTPLPALLPTILAGLFILASCGGSVLPIPGPIATESTDVANNLESNPPDSILLSVGEQPPVEKQEAEQEEEQVPAPVFEVVLAPASPPQRSFSQSQPEPQTSTETVRRSDATGESNHEDGAITFADWVASFGAGNAPPTQAETRPKTITARAKFKRRAGTNAIVYNDQGQILAKNGGGILTYTDEVIKNAGGDKHANGDPIILTTSTTITITAPPSGRERSTAYDANGNVIPDLRASSTNYDVGNDINILERVTLTQSQLDYIAENAMIQDDTRTLDNALRTRTDTEGVKNQFLQGVDALGGRLDEGPAGVVHSRGSLNLATATFGGRKLGGDAADGVGFFRGFTTENPINPEFNYPDIDRHNYAGIYSGTNLGAPVSGSGTASWNGRIRTIGYFEFDTDFTLEVTFGDNNTGTLNVARLSNPKNTNQWLMITDATYDANGVISGEIVIDEDHDLLKIQAQHGFLTGLIGEQGAVAAFLSSGDRNGDNTEAIGTKESITQGFHRFGYAGGFVAHPTATAAPVAPPNLNVRINAWTSGFTNLKRNVKRRTTNDAESSNAFLLRDDPAKRPSWKKPEGGFLALSALGGDATDGADFFPADITIIGTREQAYVTTTQRTYHAGLWDSTDLGAAISLSTNFNNKSSAMWKGKFSVFQGANARFDTDFMLMVDFVNNSFSATIEAGAKDYYLSGNYDANGVMTGQNGEATARVSYEANADSNTPKNGILTGLIGAEGAVGVFLSNKASSTDKDTIEDGTGDSGYAGGFVARPQFVNYTDLPNYTDIPTTVAGLIRTANPNSRFLRIEDGARLDTAGLTNPVLFTQRRGIEGGTGFGDGYTTIGSHGYVALLPTTDLGLPRAVGSGEPTVSWNGSYSLIRAYDRKPIIAQYAPIVFSINFETGNLTGTAPVPFNAAKTITIETSFGADGVMSGTFSTDTLNTDTERHPIETTNTNVIGLIGTEGLVGIMHGHSTGLGIIATGGFVASP